MDISVIIATRNRASWLPTSLTHLEQQTFPAARFEVVIADCASDDDTVSVVQRFASGSPIPIRVTRLDTDRLATGRNRAAAESEGQLLLFLSDDELASPRLLKNHIDAQTRRDWRGCVIGDIHPHPQVPPQALTRLSLDEGEGLADFDAPFYLDAQESNVSIPRRLFDSFGGFTEEREFDRLEHIELAYRLYQESVECSSIDDARSYVWQPAQFLGERERHYQVGYSLYHLLRLTHSRTILQRYRLRRSRLEFLIARFLMPHYVRACQRQEESNLLFAGHLYRRILSHDRASGFDDARHDRPRRPPVTREAVPATTPIATPGHNF